MSFFSTAASGHDGITVDYSPAHESAYGPMPAWVHVRLSGADAYLALSVEDARTLAQALPGVLAEHDAVVSASADKAVA
jgi:hypothetical protein